MLIIADKLRQDKSGYDGNLREKEDDSRRPYFKITHINW